MKEEIELKVGEEYRMDIGESVPVNMCIYDSYEKIIEILPFWKIKKTIYFARGEAARTIYSIKYDEDTFKRAVIRQIAPNQ